MAKKTILLYLHSIEPPLASWTVLNENNVILKTILENDLSNLITTDSQEIIVIIPSPDVLLTQAELPKLSHHRLQQAIPFAVEEQLIDEVTELHFATGKYRPENLWPVAIVAREKMIRWLEVLKQHQIVPSVMIPMPLALPLIETHWTIYNIDDLCFIRTNHFSGFTCEQENLNIYLASKLTEESQKPAEIDIYSENKISLSLKENIPTTHHKTSKKQLIEAFSQDINTHRYINLLQGDFRTKHGMPESKKLWVYAGYVTLAWVAIGFLNNLLSLTVLHHYSAKTKSSIEEIYHLNFPDAKSMITPQQHMEEKLKKLSLQASNESFLVLLAHLGKALSQSNGIHLKNLDYRDKHFTMEISATTFDNLDNLTQSLQQQELLVKQQNAEVVSAKIKATLQISAGSK